ncbi:IclR family transcriptional regulator [Micrococcus luteus]|nr:IclR family transcriptional regulator [Micrococcus luteus]
MGHNDALDGLASVRKAFALLDVVATDSRGMTAKEIAAALQMPLPTVYRMLKTLVASGHVVHLREESRYGLGYKLHALGTSLRRQVGTPPAVARLIQELHSRADAAAYYAVHRGEDIVVAYVVDSPAHPRITPMGFGFTKAAHATAFGKVLLSAMDAERRAIYLQRHGQPALTAATTTDPGQLEDQLEQVTRRGIAVEREEFVQGACCMAAPVLSSTGQTVGSVAVSMDPAYFSSHSAQMAVLLRDTAGRVGRALRGASLFQDIAAI